MSPALGIFLTILLLAINAFFVAGEFATTSTRRSQIEPLRDKGVRGAKQAMYALKHVSLMLAICQLGITVASTSLGFVAEPVIAHLIHDPLVAIGMPSASAHVVAFVVALLIVLFAHVVFGEMVPKNISIAMPHTALLILAPPLVAMGHVLHGVIHAMDNAANWFLKIRGIEPQSEISATFTVEEVASIVKLSEREGTISDDLGLLSGALEFSEETAKSDMVALDDLITVPRDATPHDVERLVAQTGFSRFPVTGDGDEIIGYIHLKDILYADTEKERLEPITAWRIRKMDRVHENDEVEDALRRMQKSGTHCALVMGESGAVIGVLFLEDILEDLVGEVRDSLQRGQIG
ncbi:MAG: hemolysin family protein [Actinomyces sp.]|nr:hemolysin family protein [Actinomyces sp.]MDU1520967.1 hemolysin family protein [Actinomyces sp.]MDU2983340.1 hemolysin family protein [Actinomyces sp.]